MKQQQPQQKLGFCCSVSVVAVSVPLAFEDAVAVVCGVLLFVSPSNRRRRVMYTYTEHRLLSAQVLYSGR